MRERNTRIAPYKGKLKVGNWVGPDEDFEILKIWGEVFPSESRNIYIITICPYCFKEFEAQLENINSKRTKSCGCLLFKHGFTGTKLRGKWFNMKNRCNDPDRKNYFKLGYDSDFEEFILWFEYIQTTPEFPGLEVIENGDYDLHRPDSGIGYYRGNMRIIPRKEHNS